MHTPAQHPARVGTDGDDAGARDRGPERPAHLHIDRVGVHHDRAEPAADSQQSEQRAAPAVVAEVESDAVHGNDPTDTPSSPHPLESSVPDRSSLAGTMADSFFTSPDGDWFQPTDPCRGPWDPTACHAGPPAGLLARKSEQLLADQQLVRLTIDLTRPIPHAGFRIAGEVTRAGRTVSTTAMTLIDGDGRPIVTARAMHIAAGDQSQVPTIPSATPRLSDAEPGRFPLSEIGHGQPAFPTGVEVRYPPGHTPDSGPTQVWMRALPLLPDELPSPFQRICPLADCGNAFSRNAEPVEVAFMNTDLTIVLHRPPEGEWLGMDSVSHWQSNLIGMSDSLLFDDRGPVGRAVQALILRPVR